MQPGHIFCEPKVIKHPLQIQGLYFFLHNYVLCWFWPNSDLQPRFVSKFFWNSTFLTAQCTLLNLCHIVSCSPTIRRGGGGGQLFLGPTMTPTQVTGLNTMSTNMLSSCIRPNISKNKLWRNLTQVGHRVSWGFDDSQKRETIKVAWLPLGAVVVAVGRKKAKL